MNAGPPVGVIGAGVAGLLTARRLLEAGLPVRILERRDGVGGLWRPDPLYGAVYRSAHLISSKHSTELTDFPMPDEYPDFPNHTLVLAYLERFAERFGITPHVTFGRQVERAEPLPRNGWRVKLDDGREDEYAGLVVATGHHWDPAPPPVATDGFDGLVMHVAQYRTPEVFAGRRVVVVGLGNSACDVAVDAVNAGADVTLSVRSGNHLIPKYLLGRPVDRIGKDGPAAALTGRMPTSLRRAVDDRLIRTLAGPPERFGLPEPRHRLYERQPLVNSQLPYHLGHGDIRIRPPVTKLHNGSVEFADARIEPADVVVWCTGYRVSLPFLDARADLCGDDLGRPRLWLNMFHPGRPDVVAVGMVDPLGSWRTLDLQAQMAAGQLRAVQVGGRPVPVPTSAAAHGSGPDRDWLFRDHSYGRELRTLLRRTGWGARS
jgi:hypothetical protein